VSFESAGRHRHRSAAAPHAERQFAVGRPHGCHLDSQFLIQSRNSEIRERMAELTPEKNEERQVPVEKDAVLAINAWEDGDEEAIDCGEGSLFEHG
jgi:hypothetical protein